MEPVKVGIREFREKLATYVLESDTRWRLQGTGIRWGTSYPLAGSARMKIARR